MKKKHLTQAEKDDIQVVMEATRNLLPFYEQLTHSEHLTEEEERLLNQIRQTFVEVLSFSNLMIQEIQTIQLENEIDTFFCRPSGGPVAQPTDNEVHQSFVTYLKDTLTDQQN